MRDLTGTLHPSGRCSLYVVPGTSTVIGSPTWRKSLFKPSVRKMVISSVYGSGAHSQGEDVEYQTISQEGGSSILTITKRKGEFSVDDNCSKGRMIITGRKAIDQSSIIAISKAT